MSISTRGPYINFDSLATSLEINCPICHSTCEYRVSENDPSLFRSHDWDSDVDLRDFDGKMGEKNRNLWREYKSLLFVDESAMKFFETEFDIVGDYLEFLGEEGIDGSTKDNDNIDNYLNQYRKHHYPSKNREKLFRRAINRFHRIREQSKPPSQ